jgi:hypothetical protein
MRNATLDTINRKALQLEAMLAVLGVADENAPDDLGEATRGNFLWVMTELVSDIRAVLTNETEANSHAECRRIHDAEQSSQGNA